MATSIIAENISKQYKIGKIRYNTTLREAITNIANWSPWKKTSRNGTIWALKNISFSIEKGEVVGIIGQNGAGKSTLLKVLSKITYPTSGKMKVHGRVASLLEVGTGFHRELTGRENIYLNGSILGMTKKEINAKFDEIVAFADVEKFIDTPIKHYSSGMRLRLGFAVAAHLEPDILLVDEILAVGDIGFQKKCLGAMKDLQSGGRTVLFVSHNMAAVENLCSRVIWIDNGQIQQTGDTEKIIEAYLSKFAGMPMTGHDLSHIANRRGSGEVRYTGIEFLDLDKQPKGVIRSADSLTVRLYYHAKKRVLNPHFAFKIYAELGTLVTELNTWLSGFDTSFLPQGDGYIDLEIDYLNLAPARYYISLYIESVGVPAHYDALDYCTVLNVEASDCYHSGREMKSWAGIICLPCKWKLGRLNNNK